MPGVLTGVLGGGEEGCSDRGRGERVREVKEGKREEGGERRV